MNHLYVIDTVSFINYHGAFFREKIRLSKRVVSTIDKCFSMDYPNYKMIIPSIVFLEIFEKQLQTDELAEAFKYEIFKPLVDNDDIEIKPIDNEVINEFYKMGDYPIKLENHDKLILSCAVQMRVPIITIDREITDFLNERRLVEHFF